MPKVPSVQPIFRICKLTRVPQARRRGARITHRRMTMDDVGDALHAYLEQIPVEFTHNRRA